MILLKQRGAIAFVFMRLRRSSSTLLVIADGLARANHADLRLPGCSTSPSCRTFWRTSSSSLHRKLAVCANVSP